MVNYSTAPLDAAFAALADPTRRALLARLARGESTVTRLAEPFDMSLPAISKHLRVLERAGLVRREAIGRERHCRLEAKPLRRATAWLEHYRQFWEARLDALEGFLLSGRKQTHSAEGRRAHGRTRAGTPRQTRHSQAHRRSPRKGLRRLA